MTRPSVQDEEYKAAIKRSVMVTKHLVEQYGETPFATLRDRAEYEHQLWLCVLPEDRTIIRRRHSTEAPWLHQRLKPYRDEIEISFRVRGMLLHLEEQGFDVSSGWEYLTRSTSPARVQEAIHHARTVMRMKGLRKIELTKEAKERFNVALGDYLANRSRAAGAVHVPRSHKRRKQPDSAAPAAQDAAGQAARDPIAHMLVTESKKLWAALKEATMAHVAPFVRRRLKDVETPGVAAEIEERFAVDLKISYDEMINSLQRVSKRKGAIANIEVKREKVRWALEALRIPVKNGWSKEALRPKEIKLAHRKLSARFHPDANPGTDRYTERYKEVQEAFALLKDYCSIA